MKSIGRMDTGELFYPLTENFVVAKSGEVLAVDPLGVIFEAEVPYQCVIDPAKHSQEECLSKIVRLDKLHIDNSIVNLIDHKIDGEPFILSECDEDDNNAFTQIIFRDVRARFFDNGSFEMTPKTDISANELAFVQSVFLKIEKAIDYKVDGFDLLIKDPFIHSY